MSDRHSKWVRVEPGTVIPAGQPYRVEWTRCDGADHHAAEYPGRREGWLPSPMEADQAWFVDSSWKPPLVLPTEGDNWYLLALRREGSDRPKFRIAKGRRSGPYFAGYRVADIIDAAPLTDEQVLRIESHHE